MLTRSRILEAASRLFGELGYQATTTRRIALEAGVSEVTLFRQFGTKDALLREALGAVTSSKTAIDTLPANPIDPERELVEWCAGYLHQLRATRPIIRRSMGELADRPSLIPRTAAVPARACQLLKAYLKKANEKRMLPSGFDVTTAATILAGVLFADALSRDFLPGGFPEPASRAHELYVRFVLQSGSSRPSARSKSLSRSRTKLTSSSGASAEARTRFDRRRTPSGKSTIKVPPEGAT